MLQEGRCAAKRLYWQTTEIQWGGAGIQGQALLKTVALLLCLIWCSEKIAVKLTFETQTGIRSQQQKTVTRLCVNQIAPFSFKYIWIFIRFHCYHTGLTKHYTLQFEIFSGTWQLLSAENISFIGFLFFCFNVKITITAVCSGWGHKTKKLKLSMSTKFLKQNTEGWSLDDIRCNPVLTLGLTLMHVWGHRKYLLENSHRRRYWNTLSGNILLRFNVAFNVAISWRCHSLHILDQSFNFLPNHWKHDGIEFRHQ